MKKTIVILTILTALIGFSSLRISGASEEKLSITPKNGKLDPNKTLTTLESDIKDLMADIDKKEFDVTPAESDTVKTALSSLYVDITNLHAKYRAGKGEVDAAPFLKEIETTL